MMRTDFDLYVQRNSWLHHLDPRVKLLFIALVSFFLFAWPTSWMAGTMVLILLILLATAQIPMPRIARIWRLMGPLMLLVFVLTALFGGATGSPWFALGPFTVTADATELGAVLALRLLAFALVVFLLLFTTDQATIVRGLVALHVPYAWGLTLVLALRYLPIFAGLFAQVREAQQSRGLDLDQKRFWQRLRAYQPVLIAMIITALRQSERLGWALEARALGATDVKRTVFRPLHLGTTDVAALGILAVVLLAGIVIRYS